MHPKGVGNGRWSEKPHGPVGIAVLVVVVAVLGNALLVPGLPHAGLCHAVVTGAAVCAEVLLLLLHQTDPGVVAPRDTPDPDVAAAEELERQAAASAGSGTGAAADAAARTGQLEARVVRDAQGRWTKAGEDEPGAVLRYCATCHIWKQPRVSHCGVCGHCIRRFDHHCPAVGTCIGENNHALFIGFLLSAAAGLVVCALGNLRHLVQMQWSRQETWLSAVRCATVAG
eukprot:TRINITY_DN2554_c0_g1_i3.p2 TRINITY_DN2554_c0_g1~~TRINITY_DN2554_c0_g1_i3.p2  ORF type:complete len:228 (+),score=33.07 TRINITY_DN2554_c0_g1_i3:1-684(+)